jgi:hypothetical protein
MTKSVKARRAARLILCVASSAMIMVAALAGSTEAESHGGGGHGGGGHGGGGHGGGGHFGGGGHGGGYHGGGYHGGGHGARGYGGRGYGGRGWNGRGWGGGYYPDNALDYGEPYYCTPPLVWEVIGEGGQCF